MNLKKNFLLINLVWLGLISFSFLWSYYNARAEQKRLAFLTARSVFKQIVITRRWNAENGGVYAAVGEMTQPNPHLITPYRDLKVKDAFLLTKVNPAFMTRQISEIAESEEDGLKFHITSLNPIRPENKATEIEAEFLASFEKGKKEEGVFLTEGGRKIYKYMAPLVTEKSCLPCHAKQGYKEGDIRGGISVTLPFSMKIPLFSLFLSHLIIYCAGLSGIVVLGRRLSDSYQLISYQAVMDSLTSIPNRRSFTSRIEKEYKLSRNEELPLSVIMCDIDRFKKYNDLYGHVQGDVTLREVAQTIKDSLKRPGDFCARYGGEEFVVLLPNCSRAGGLLVAERIRENIAGLKIEHKQSSAGLVALSLGVVCGEDVESTSYEQLVQAADKALYHAKNSGRNQVCSFYDIKREN